MRYTRARSRIGKQSFEGNRRFALLTNAIRSLLYVLESKRDFLVPLFKFFHERNICDKLFHLVCRIVRVGLLAREPARRPLPVSGLRRCPPVRSQLLLKRV